MQQALLANAEVTLEFLHLCQRHELEGRGVEPQRPHHHQLQSAALGKPPRGSRPSLLQAVRQAVAVSQPEVLTFMISGAIVIMVAGP